MRGILCLLWLASAGMALADSHFSSWADFDGYVQAQYDRLAQGQAFAVFPPSDFHFGVSRGVFAFNAGEMPEITNSAPPEIIMEAPSWQVRVRETSDATRLFIAEVHGVGVRTNGVSAYDAQAWARDAYGDPPEWLDGDGLAAWYAERSRERAELCLTLIPSGHYGTYLANRSAAATNAFAGGAPAAPADTNRIAFARVSVDPSSSLLGFTLYSPGAHAVDIFGRDSLIAGGWLYRGTASADCPFTEAAVYSPSGAYFLTAARGDIDADGDGIPDGMETLQFGTGPLLWDSSGDGISDWMKLYRYGLDPLLRDTDGDGYDDDEEIAGGQDPSAFNDGAGATIRYIHDDDGRLTASYPGASKGAATAALTPAGNASTLHERSAK